MRIPARVLTLIAMVGIVVYVVVDIVLQLLPPHYSVIADAESNLGVGPFGWVMSLNFLGRAVTSIALGGALLLSIRHSIRRNLGLTLFVTAGSCSAVLAFFPTDIAPTGATRVAPTTVQGAVHLVAASTGFVLALVGCWLLTLELREAPVGTASLRPTALFLGIASVGLLFLAVTIVALPAILGLAERICLVGILGWAFATARQLRSR